MSSHREAPEISKDPVADNTDVYAFVDPIDPSKVTLIANYIPFEEPAGGPNFFQFGDDVLYEIKIDNDGDARADVIYQFRFKTRITNPNTFLYNTGPITALDSASWNLRQSYSVTRVVVSGDEDEVGERRVLAPDLMSPPVRIGPRSTPNYAALASAAIHSLPGGVTVFAGQRDEGFFVDVGSIFDLGTLRPFKDLHLIKIPGASVGIDGTKGFNVHSIALRVPKTDLTRDGSVPLNVMDPRSVIGVWATASRQRGMMRGDDGGSSSAGSWVQVSRLGNPLINEVIIPMSRKDGWNSREPRRDADFAVYYRDPELQNLLPVLYPGVFPNLAALLAMPAASRSRDDLVAILGTGIPTGVIPGFQNFTGSAIADMLRLNLAFPPASTPSPLGLLGGDTAGFPNGRRVADNVVAIELRAVAGLTLPLVRTGYVADGAASALTDGTANEQPYLAAFPYLAHPHEGYEHSHDHA